MTRFKKNEDFLKLSKKEQKTIEEYELKKLFKKRYDEKKSSKCRYIITFYYHLIFRSEVIRDTICVARSRTKNEIITKKEIRHCSSIEKDKISDEDCIFINFDEFVTFSIFN